MATILVVDDETHIATLLQDVLEDEGYIVFAAGNGRDALAIARRERPAVILSDVMMPLMDGITLSRALRQEPATAMAVVVLMSAAPVPDYRGAGATAFIAKPFALADVIAIIAAHLAP